MATLNAQYLSVVSRFVSSFPPFASYAFGLMMKKLSVQLHRRSNVLVLDGPRLVAYAGWVLVDGDLAQEWQIHGGDLPPSDWVNGQAVIVTMVVTVDHRYLPMLIRGVSNACAGKKVYRMRYFQDGRPNARRPPITGRQHSRP